MTEPTDTGLLAAATRFTFGARGGDPTAYIDVATRSGIGPHGTDVIRWAITCNGFTYSHNGRWLYEAIPSYRTGKYLRATRWADRDKAIATARTLIAQGHPDTEIWTRGRRVSPAVLKAEAQRWRWASQYGCPLCDTWWHNGPHRVTVVDDPRPLVDAQSAENQERLAALGRVVATDERLRAHCETHTIDEWVAAADRLTALHGAVRHLADITRPDLDRLTSLANHGGLRDDELHWIQLVADALDTLAAGAALDCEPPDPPRTIGTEPTGRAADAAPSHVPVVTDDRMSKATVSVVSGGAIMFLTGISPGGAPSSTRVRPGPKRATDTVQEVVDFTTARLDERERAARICLAVPPQHIDGWTDPTKRWPPPGINRYAGDPWPARLQACVPFIALNDPQSALSDVAAKRELLKRFAPPPSVVEPDQKLHASGTHPAYEYACRPRRIGAGEDPPPDGEGWERNTDVGRDGWDRFLHIEQSYWRRLRPDGPPRTRVPLVLYLLASSFRTHPGFSEEWNPDA